ncbi:immunity protein Imm33 domain-containing protein [Humisphaera borealis]|uniref:Imm33-like domain-containing protein n=1 Tax=Humisphaera borealis TaxID=2807512 RepID=A0A7M2X6M1_9BACT|nr:hypothetical protein IPV69_19695 [Humisphaera borealis]
MNALMDRQRQICQKYKSEFMAAPLDLKVGISRSVRDGVLPIHGLRIRPAHGTTGWFVWAGGEMLQAPDFFVPLHVEHLQEWCPIIIPFLGLAPGWRFLIADGHEDVWFDGELLSES